MNIPLYIIPARGGSKGIPHKNIAPLAGRPLIAYTIDAALEAQQQTGGYILVSTDDDNIAAAAENCGIKVGYRRPPELATDTAGSRETIIHAMDWADARGIVFDSVVLLQPTSPLRNAADIMATIKAYDNDPQADMALTQRRQSVLQPFRDRRRRCFTHLQRPRTVHPQTGRSQGIPHQRRRVRDSPFLAPTDASGRVLATHPRGNAFRTQHRHRLAG